MSPLATQLSWTHFTILLTVPSDSARKFYTQQAADHLWPKRELNLQQNQELTQLRDWLLPMLMNGQVTVG